MDKSKYQARTMDDPCVIEGLCAVSQLEREEKTKNLSFLVGGIATQSYLPSSCRRETADIDLAVMESLSYSAFKEFSRPVRAYLEDRGFSVNEKKGHNAYMLIYVGASESKNGQTGIIEFARRSPENMARIKKRLERVRSYKSQNY